MKKFIVEPEFWELFPETQIGIVLAKNIDNSMESSTEIKKNLDEANENAELNNIKNCKFIAGDVFKKAEELREADIRPDIVIFDPPRAGVGQKALEKILEFDMNEIIYVSCNPKTFIQDVEILKKSGFELVKSECVDMFPNTPHVETVVLMSRVDK